MTEAKGPSASDRKILDKAGEKGGIQPSPSTQPLVEKGLLVWESFGTFDQCLVPSAAARALLLGADPAEVEEQSHGTGEPGTQEETAAKGVRRSS